MEIEYRKLTPQLFEPADIAGLESERISRPPVGFWRDSWIRLRKHRGALISLAVLIFLFFMAFLLGPLLSWHSPYGVDVARAYEGVSSEYWFGTDKLGRDMWTRVWEGTRVSLYIGLLAALLDVFVGVVYGAVSGFAGGWVDDVLQRVLEILSGIPSLVVAILAMVILNPGILTLTIAMGLAGWTLMARIVRGRMIQLKNQEFALASRSLGASGFRLVWKHLLPNTLGLIIVNLTFTVPDAIFGEAFLSFIGLGIQPPHTSLGALISEGAASLRFHPHLLWLPSAVFFLLMVCFNLLGDGLRDALDPRMRS
ncbi:MAG: ABC transporter permease [Actinomycetota bacterium]|nr:ABC transporter permease [Actinomycetota bacterium]